MVNRGTAPYTLGQFTEVEVSLIRALPKALEGTDPKELIPLLQKSGERIERGLSELLRSLHDSSVIASSVIPADGVEFELTLDRPVDPMGMVRGDGYDPKGWQFTGSQLAVPQTRRFKLVRVGYCGNFDELLRKLAEHGDIPQGQWREAFKKVYPQNDGKGLIGVPDPSWLYPNGDARFPALFEDGEGWDSYFGWTGSDFYGSWRWLVACK